MNIEYFKTLEEKLNQLINRVVSLKKENNELTQANRNLEDKIQSLMGENELLNDKNSTLSIKAKESENADIQETEIKNRLEDILRKVDEVVEA
jgi:FtsZ-binding cell division protein ZapB